MWIKNLEIENWAGFPGVHKIEFSIDPKKPVTIIHAENGHGKTNILAAMKWVLHKTLPTGINGKELIDKGIVIKEKEKAFAKVSMVISQEDDELDEDLVKEYRISRSIDSNHVVSEVKIEPNGPGGWGVFQGRHQSFIEQILPEELSDIFLFNGEELSENFASERAKSLEKSILKVTGVQSADDTLSNLNALYEDLDNHIDDLNSKDTKSKQVAQEKKDLKNEINNLQTKIDGYDADLLNEKNGKNATETSLQSIQDPQIDAAIKDMRDARTEIDKIKPELKEKKEESKDLIQEYGFAIFLHKLKFPSYQEASKKTKTNPFPITPVEKRNEFLEELEKNNECICGTKLEDIPDFASQVRDWLEQDGKKDPIDKAYNDLKTFKLNNSRQSDSFLKSFKAIEDHINTLTLNLTSHQDKLSNAEDKLDKVNIDEREEDKDDLVKQLENHNSEIDRITGLLDDPITGLNKLMRDKKSELQKIQNKKISLNTHEIKTTTKRRDFILRVKNRLLIEKNTLTKSMKDKIKDTANELLKKYHKLGAKFEFDGDSYTPRLIDPGFDEEVRLSKGNTTFKSVFYGAALVAAAESRIGEKSKIIDKGVKAAWVCDAPFSNLDDANLESCAKVILARERQLIVFVNNQSYISGFEKMLVKNKKLGKQYLIERHISGEKPTETDTKVKIGKKNYESVKKSKEKFPFSKIIKI